jgi:hypothetical protein
MFLGILFGITFISFSATGYFKRKELREKIVNVICLFILYSIAVLIFSAGLSGLSIADIGILLLKTNAIALVSLLFGKFAYDHVHAENHGCDCGKDHDHHH